MVYLPVWKDTSYLYLGASNPVVYDITDSGGTVLFTGKAYKRPDTNYVYIKVNDIFSAYLSNNPFTNLQAGAYTNPNALMVFRLYCDDALAEEYTVLYDWSYEDWNGESGCTTTPIDGKIAEGMYVVRTDITSAMTLTNTILPYSAYNETSLYNKGYTGCWAMYYQQVNGAFASWLVSGLVRRTDNINRYEMTRSYYNTTIGFGRKPYLTEIEGEWEINTGWLTEAQAENFARNLISSPTVYLHNLCDTYPVPVVIEDDSVEYKTHKGLNNKLISYTFTVKESQKRYIK